MNESMNRELVDSIIVDPSAWTREKKHQDLPLIYHIKPDSSRNCSDRRSIRGPKEDQIISYSVTLRDMTKEILGTFLRRG